MAANGGGIQGRIGGKTAPKVPHTDIWQRMGAWRPGPPQPAGVNHAELA